MALSAPGTPKSVFATPKRLPKTPSANFENFATPTSKSQLFTTPKSTNKAPSSMSNTPECFSNVAMETPNSAVKKSRRSSGKDKYDQVSNLTVAVRIRPMNSRELATVGAANVVRVRDQELIIRSNPTGNAGMGLDHLFQYDHVFWSCDETSPLYSSQEDVFLTIGKPLLNSAFRGYNACLFAYGQTGSGKSFSMMGRNTCEIVDIDSEEQSGLTPRFCRDLFTRISNLKPEDGSATVEVSYFEIYNEKIHDLLASPSSCPSKTPLKVREHPEWGPYVVDLSVQPVKTYKELRNWLLLGNKNRATAATTMNEKSSRSHSIFSIELCLSGGTDADSSRRSKVSLVDLAGSERLVGSHNSEEKIRQGVSINKSLLTLGKVISSLADQKRNQFVPYRDSVLTWLLRESLGGNSLTSMLATITPANTHLDETLATLRYACQARSIVNRARINENPHDRLIRELKQEVLRLKALKQDYERNSFSTSNNSSLTIQLDDSADKEELEALRLKLGDAESKLSDAEENWKRRFMESAQSQLKELAESEKRREELESKVRVMRTLDDNNVTLSPYKTNFLQELEGVLSHSKEVASVDGPSEDSAVENLIDWCFQNNLKCTLTSTTVTITDCVHKRQTFLLTADLDKFVNFESVGNYINGLTWTDIEPTNRKLNKTDVMTCLNQIYQALDALQPSDASSNHVNLSFAKVNKALQGFEAALLSNLAKSSNQKSVTFNL